MLLNGFERRLVTGPWRRWAQRHIDAKRLLKLGGAVEGGTVLEVGCGSGFGVELLHDLFGAQQVHAFDADPAMVAATRQRLTRKGRMGGRHAPRLWQGDCTSIQAPTAEFDAVFSFQVLHHIEDWRTALAEVARVLKPGGKLYLAETMRSLIEHPLWGRFMHHPNEDRFDRMELQQVLGTHGFRPLGERCFASWFYWSASERHG